MDKIKILKGLGLLASLLSIAGTVLGEIANEKKTDRIIEEKVQKAIIQREEKNKEKES